MIDLESQINLRDDSQEVANFAMERGGVISCEPLERRIYWLVLAPRAAIAETYIVRVAWDRYPHDPPSVKFATSVGGRIDVTTAWPIIGGYRPGNFDICKPFTKEAFEVHPEWRGGPERWPAEAGNPFLWVVSILRDDMDSGYQGRSG